MKKVFDENKRTEPVEVAVSATFAGRVKMEVHRDHGESRGVVAEFDNMILDSGLRGLLGYRPNNLANNCHLGTSSAPVTPDQVGLVSRINGAYVEVSGPEERANVGGDPFLVTNTWVYAFGKGRAAGVIAELGFSASRGSNWVSEPLFSRALVRDAAGDPTTITVADDEFLTVTYVLSGYIDVSDKPFTLNMSSGAHDGILRPSNLKTSGTTTLYGHSFSFSSYYGTGAVLGGIDAKPSGSSEISFYDKSSLSEESDSLVYRDTLLTIGLGVDATSRGGIHALYMYGPFCQYQMSFDPPIPKTGENVFSLRMRYSVGRR